MNKVDTRLKIRPGKQESLDFPKIEKPQLIGYFSVNQNRDYEPGAENLRYCKFPDKFPLDLNKGYRSRIQKPENAPNMEKLDNILHFISTNRELLVKQGDVSMRALIDCEFISYRGLLRLIMCTPYEFRNDWCIHVTKYQGNFYLCQVETDKSRHQRINETETQKRMCSWGFKFEQYCLTDDPSRDPNTDLPVDECSEFCCAFMTKLEGLQLFYVAEMDGIMSNNPVNINDKSKIDELPFIEIKVSEMEFKNPRQQENFNKFKCRNWWCQSFLVGINDIYVGSRNSIGFVKKIDHIEVRSLPKLGTHFWTPNVCLNFLAHFLNCVKSLMQDVNCPYTVFEFYFDPEKSNITYKRLDKNTPHSFLPDWYITMLESLRIK